jgi:hypothetical protein
VKRQPLREYAIIRAVDEALGELQRQAGGTFDPKMLLEARNMGIGYGISLIKSTIRLRRYAEGAK